MRLYAAVAWRGFRRYATYRAAALAGIFTQTVFGFILAFTRIALWEARPTLGGYDVTEAVTYVWFGQLMLVTVAIFGGGFQVEFAERIRQGDVAIDIVRPINLQLWWLASDLGRALFHLLGRGIPPTLIGALVFQFRLPNQLTSWLGLAASMLLAIVVSFALRYIIALAAFWLMDARGIEQLAAVLATFMSGMLLPLTVIPGWVGELAQVLPWSAMLQVPADVLLGKYAGGQILSALGFQAMWVIILLAIGQALTLIATRKVVVQGG